MSVDDFAGRDFWATMKQFVIDAGVEPISLGEPEDESWRKIRAAADAVGQPLSLGLTPGEVIKAAFALGRNSSGASGGVISFDFSVPGNLTWYSIFA